MEDTTAIRAVIVWTHVLVIPHTLLCVLKKEKPKMDKKFLDLVMLGSQKRAEDEARNTLISKDFTLEESQAIHDIARLNMNWPESLTLVSSDGILYVMKGQEADKFGHLYRDQIIATLKDIPNHGGDERILVDRKENEND